MSSPIIKVKCETYLIRFLESLYGPSPIKFPKASNFVAILDYCLDIPPLDWKEPDYGDESLAIQLPFFETKNVLSYYYLSDPNQMFLRDQFYMFFKITFRSEISKILVMQIKKQRKDAIECFMRKHNLPMSCWDLLEKDYQRYIRLGWKKRLFKNNKNLSVNGVSCPTGDMECSKVERSVL